MSQMWSDAHVERFLAGLAADPALAERVIARLYAAAPDYRPMAREQHLAMLRDEFSVMLQGLAGDGPAQVDLAHAVATGTTRARQGVSLVAMVDGFHLTLRLLWEEVLAQVGDDVELSAALARRLLRVWTWSDIVTSAAAGAHAEATQERRDTEAVRLLGMLDQLETVGENALTVLEARRLGFDPDRIFVVASVPLDGFAAARRVVRHLHPATVQVTPRGTIGVVVIQGIDPDRVVREFGSRAPAIPVGVSTARPGLSALPRCQVEAQRVLELAVVRRRALAYDAHWLLAILLENRRDLPASLEFAIGVAADNPHLVEAVGAFADHGLSVAGAARAIHVHANTLRYRLERWTELTGLDPHTFDGLARSVTAVELAR